MQELRTFPFPWAHELTAAAGQGGPAVCALLRCLGIHGLPLWNRECLCQDDMPFGALAPGHLHTCLGTTLGFLTTAAQVERPNLHA